MTLTEQIAALAASQVETQRQLQTLLARDPEKEFRYGSGFQSNPTGQDSFPRQQTVIAPIVSSGSPLDPATCRCSCSVDVRQFRVMLAGQNSMGGSNTNAVPSHCLRIEMANNQEFQNFETIFLRPSFVFSSITSQNLGTGEMTILSTWGFDEILPFQRRYLRFRLYRMSAALSATPLNVNQIWNSLTPLGVFVTFYGN